jgi:hypothetical protein
MLGIESGEDLLDLDRATTGAADLVDDLLAVLLGRQDGHEAEASIDHQPRSVDVVAVDLLIVVAVLVLARRRVE